MKRAIDPQEGTMIAIRLTLVLIHVPDEQELVHLWTSSSQTHNYRVGLCAGSFGGATTAVIGCKKI